MTQRVVAKTLNTSIIFLASGILCLLVLYGYFLFGAISNGGEIGRLRVTISEQSSSLGELEADYMSLKKTLSVEEAYALGFKSTEPVYIAQNNSAVAFNR